MELIRAHACSYPVQGLSILQFESSLEEFSSHYNGSLDMYTMLVDMSMSPEYV